MNRFRALIALLCLSACGTRPALAPDSGATQDGGEPDSGSPGTGDAGPEDAGFLDAGPGDAGTPDAGADLDLDGLPDDYEARLAVQYLPYLAMHPDDGCTLGGIVYRVRKHPQDPTLIHILYDHLYQNDCGFLSGHVGDDEVFAITVNPAKPPPAGITAMKAISHQGTACEKVTSCGACNGLGACELGTYDAGARPMLYSSKDKHGSYATLTGCNTFSCLDVCAAAASPSIPMVNAGEPSAHLIGNLTTQAFVNADAGWTEASLYGFDPWDPVKTFGTAGVISSDLTDPAFDTEPCR